MKSLITIIDGKEYPIVSTNWVLRQYGIKYGYNSLQSTINSLGFLAKYDNASDETEIEWEDLERLSHIGFLAIKEGCDVEKVACDITEKQVFNAINRAEVCASVIIAIMQGLPQPSTEVETEEVKKK